MKKKKPQIHFILTGGTIDSYYDGTKDTVVPNKESIIPYYIKNLRLYHSIVFTQVCMKDSRDLDKSDLKEIKDAIEKSKSNKIIVTHGTYTMPDTARYLKANLKRRNQIIILTGAMLPIKEFTISDGAFNLGYSISKLEDLPNGIYVCMNGKIFTPEEVLKVIKEGRFSSIFTP